MKNKFFLFISLILIALVAITSYTPQAAQAEMQTQKDPVSEAGEDPLRPDADNQINANENGFFNAVGINFVPHDSHVTYYNGIYGCLGSDYDGPESKTFSIPVNVPDGVKGARIFLTYKNVVSNPSTPIYVSLWRRHFLSLFTEEVISYQLNDAGEGGRSNAYDIFDLTFDTASWIYWLEFRLPEGESTREFCGVSMGYKNPPLFPVALPMIQR